MAGLRVRDLVLASAVWRSHRRVLVARMAHDGAAIPAWEIILCRRDPIFPANRYNLYQMRPPVLSPLSRTGSATLVLLRNQHSRAAITARPTPRPRASGAVSMRLTSASAPSSRRTAPQPAAAPLEIRHHERPPARRHLLGIEPKMAHPHLGIALPKLRAEGRDQRLRHLGADVDALDPDFAPAGVGPDMPIGKERRPRAGAQTPRRQWRRPRGRHRAWPAAGSAAPAPARRRSRG